MRDVDSVSGGRANIIKMGSKLSVDGSVSEVSLHHTEFALGAVLPSIEFNLLALYRLKFALMCSISINVSDNAGILEINNGIVNEESGGGGRVKNIEVVILDPRTIEIGSWMRTHMEGDGVLRVAVLASPYNVSIDTNLPKGDILCHLILSVLIEEDKWVLPCITTVILTPPCSWMVWVIKLLSELRDVGDGAGCGGKGNGGVVLSKSNWFIALYIVV